MKYATEIVVTVTALATTGQAQLTARTKLRTTEDSTSPSHHDDIDNLRALQEGAGAGSMSFPTGESIETLSDVVTAGKGSKSAKGPNNPKVDYQWVVGEYKKCIRSRIRLIDGEVQSTREDVDRSDFIFSVQKLTPDTNRMFNATKTLVGLMPCANVGISPPHCPNSTKDYFTDIRYVHEGVGSYNPIFQDQITFYSDHQEILEFNTTSGDYVWVPYGSSGEEDVSTMRCSKLEDYPDGKSIVCDQYESLPGAVLGGSIEYLVTFFWSEE